MHRLAFSFALGLALGTASLEVGCAACNNSVCDDTLWVYFAEPGGGPLEAGTYELTVAADGADPQTASCDIGAGGATASCTGLDFILYTPLYDSPENPHEVLHLFFEGQPPQTLAVTIVHDGTTVFDEVLEPSYELAEPRCDPDCRHATEDHELTR